MFSIGKFKFNYMEAKKLPVMVKKTVSINYLPFKCDT